MLNVKYLGKAGVIMFKFLIEIGMWPRNVPSITSWTEVKLVLDSYFD